MSENYNDYISRTYPAVRYVDDADKDTDELCMKCKGENCGFIGMIGFWACQGFIPKEQEAQQGMSAIPAADVRPVVLCRDCKHKGWVQEPEHGKSVDYCRLIERCVDKQFFCAAGERKTNCGADMRGESDV